jgi:outer membrane protein assembly factor BamD (BamD/ComL family)
VFHRLGVLWTPTVLILDPSGAERRRSEGYVPREEFFAELHLGLARVAFMRKDWAEAERLYGEVVARFPNTTGAAEAVYWRGVSRYKGTSDHTSLPAVAAEFERHYQQSPWAVKASIWRSA